jgi:hypothetical protein
LDAKWITVTKIYKEISMKEHMKKDITKAKSLTPVQLRDQAILATLILMASIGRIGPRGLSLAQIIKILKVTGSCEISPVELAKTMKRLGIPITENNPFFEIQILNQSRTSSIPPLLGLSPSETLGRVINQAVGLFEPGRTPLITTEDLSTLLSLLGLYKDPQPQQVAQVLREHSVREEIINNRTYFDLTTFIASGGA